MDFEKFMNVSCMRYFNIYNLVSYEIQKKKPSEFQKVEKIMLIVNNTEPHTKHSYKCLTYYK